MDRKKLETIVLAAGALVFGAGLFLMLTRGSNPGNIFITNIIFAVGFLIYIIYSIMNTSSLQQEIKNLNNHVAALKGELEKRKQELSEKEQQLSEVTAEKQKLQERVTELEAQVKNLNQELEIIRTEAKGASSEEG